MTEHLQPPSGDEVTDSEWQAQQDQMALQWIETEKLAATKQHVTLERELRDGTRHLRWPSLGGILGMFFGWCLTCVALYFMMGLPAAGDSLAKPMLVILTGLSVLAACAWLFFTFTEKRVRP